MGPIGCGCLAIGWGILNLGLCLLVVIAAAMGEISVGYVFISLFIFLGNAVLLLVIGYPKLRNALIERGVLVSKKGKEDEEDEESDEDDEDEAEESEESEES